MRWIVVLMVLAACSPDMQAKRDCAGLRGKPELYSTCLQNLTRYYADRQQPSEYSAGDAAMLGLGLQLLTPQRRPMVNCTTTHSDIGAHTTCY